MTDRKLTPVPHAPFDPDSYAPVSRVEPPALRSQPAPLPPDAEHRLLAAVDTLRADVAALHTTVADVRSLMQRILDNELAHNEQHRGVEERLGELERRRA
jgi:hypothetical protein